MADKGIEAALALLVAKDGFAIDRRYWQFGAEARRQLFAEHGDPSPRRLGWRAAAFDRLTAGSLDP
jgi:hypothetical protein